MWHFIWKTADYENVLDVLGAVDSGVFSGMFNAVIEGRTKGCITQLEEIVIQGRELGQFVTDFIWYLRNLLLVQSADDAEGLLDMSEENLKQLKRRLYKDRWKYADALYPYFLRTFQSAALCQPEAGYGGSGFDQTYQTVYGTGPGLCSPTV